MQTARRKALSISQATRALRHLLEGQFADLWVEGEVSNLRTYRSGHWYFTLKDDRSQLPAVMFAGDSHRLRFEVKDGMQALARGRISYYEAGGRAQMIVRTLEPSGLGARAQALKQLSARLRAEGLFDSANKKTLPLVPRRLGVVTSPSGAALRDILRVSLRRFPSLPVVIAATRVQGEGASAELARALRRLDDSGLCDVIIVGRGGGSSEDLEIFSAEVVVRAVAACHTPVVSAVGHETDTPLCDHAADLRAATPSAAAERVVPEYKKIELQLRGLCHAMVRRVQAQLTQARAELRNARITLGDPRALLQSHRQDLDGQMLRAERALQRHVLRARARHRVALSRLDTNHPRQQAMRARSRHSELKHRLLTGFAAQLSRHRRRLSLAAATLNALSPLDVLGRGYAICSHKGRVLRDASLVEPGDAVELRLHTGRLSTEVRSVGPAGDDGKEPG